MIRGIHGLLYSSNPNATRAFFRDVVQLPGNDIGGGWWIFDFPEGDLGVHPIEPGAKAGEHDVSFYCDDIVATVRALRARGVKFTHPVADHGYGLVTYFQAPGGIKIQLYEPKYTKPAKRGTRKTAARSSGTKKPSSPVKARGTTHRHAAKKRAKAGTQSRPAKKRR